MMPFKPYLNKRGKTASLKIRTPGENEGKVKQQCGYDTLKLEPCTNKADH